VGGKDRWTEGLDLAEQPSVDELPRHNGRGSGRGEEENSAALLLSS